ncbi:unnamed protein product, partial [Effrenium voratum]
GPSCTASRMSGHGRASKRPFGSARWRCQCGCTASCASSCGSPSDLQAAHC